MKTRHSSYPDNSTGRGLSSSEHFFFPTKKTEVTSEKRIVLREEETSCQGKVADGCLINTCGIELSIKEQLSEAIACPLD